MAARAAVAERTAALFRRAGALREGHFLLKSGRHSERYLEKFLLLQDPAVTSELCAFWAAAARGADGRPLVDVVAGPTTGGIVLAFETARQLGVRGIFAEEVRAADGSTRREFRRGFAIEPGERVLLVDDILTTGGSLQAMLPPSRRPAARSSAASSWPTAPAERPSSPRRRRAGATPSRGSGSWRSPPSKPGPPRARAAPTGRRWTRRGAGERARASQGLVAGSRRPPAELRPTGSWAPSASSASAVGSGSCRPWVHLLPPSMRPRARVCQPG